jgi:hypothetical protein
MLMTIELTGTVQHNIQLHQLIYNGMKGAPISTCLDPVTIYPSTRPNNVPLKMLAQDVKFLSKRRTSSFYQKEEPQTGPACRVAGSYLAARALQVRALHPSTRPANCQKAFMSQILHVL